mmetsp:Transcript_21104/g.37966  ORF Transcript_21104/g.37966 Transcript_21104/m.37966 type:complete len:203 (-) Transcript_21104:623-1231(-)
MTTILSISKDSPRSPKRQGEQRSSKRSVPSWTLPWPRQQPKSNSDWKATELITPLPNIRHWFHALQELRRPQILLEKPRPLRSPKTNRTTNLVSKPCVKSCTPNWQRNEPSVPPTQALSANELLDERRRRNARRRQPKPLSVRKRQLPTQKTSPTAAINVSSFPATDLPSTTRLPTWHKLTLVVWRVLTQLAITTILQPTRL